MSNINCLIIGRANTEIKLSDTHFFKFSYFIFWYFRERAGEQEREGGKHQFEKQFTAFCTCPQNLQPRHMPWLGIELATFQVAGQHPTNWTTLVGDWHQIFNVPLITLHSCQCELGNKYWHIWIHFQE